MVSEAGETNAVTFYRDVENVNEVVARAGTSCKLADR